MIGTAGAAIAPKVPCSELLANLEGVPAKSVVRSRPFEIALRFWPKWASELDPSQPYFHPANRLTVHDDPTFLKLSPEERFNMVEKHLLGRENIIEQGLAELPKRIALRTRMPFETVKNLTALFLEDSMTSNKSICLWMKYQKRFYLAAVEELIAVEENFGVTHQLAIERFYRELEKSPLEDGFDENLRITARVMELTDNWKTVEQVSEDIYHHWWSRIFPGYNRYPYLSNMTKSSAGLDSLNQFLLNDLPKLDLSHLNLPQLDHLSTVIDVTHKLEVDPSSLADYQERVLQAISDETKQTLLGPVDSGSGVTEMLVEPSENGVNESYQP